MFTICITMHKRVGFWGCRIDSCNMHVTCSVPIMNRNLSENGSRNTDIIDIAKFAGENKR